MRAFVIIALVLVGVACATPPGTNAVGGARPPATSSSETTVALAEQDAALRSIEKLPPIEQMRSALRALATAQEEYHGRNGRFTDDIAALREMPGCIISRQVEVTVVSLVPRGWASRSRHPGLPGRSCVQIAGGRDVPVPTTDRDSRRGDEQRGAVICDSLPDVEG